MIFHLKVGAKANWGRMGEALAAIDKAERRRGAQVSATMYPYAAGGTGLAATLPLWVQEGGRETMLERLDDPATRARARQEIETTHRRLGEPADGRHLRRHPGRFGAARVSTRSSSASASREIAAERKADPWDVSFRLLIDSGGRVGALYHMMSEEDVRTGLRSPFVTIGTDSAAMRTEGALAQGPPHPRAYGTFPRVLGKYVRDDKAVVAAGSAFSA